MPDPIVTNWIAISGAPSSGKTSVIQELKNRGFHTEVESARQVIEEKLSAGHTLADIRNPLQVTQLQTEILQRKVDLERTLDTANTVFLDRGIPDSLAYFRLANIDTTIAAKASTHHKYNHVFVFDRLPLQKDSVRSEDDETAQRLDQMIFEDYQALGYAPVRVPVLPIGKRTDFILNHVKSCAAA